MVHRLVGAHGRAPRQWAGIGRPLIALGLLLALVALGGRPQTAAAHPLGNFTTNQYVRIEAAPDGLRLVYVLDLAEIPAFREIGERVDADGDGAVSDAEGAAYLDAKLAEIVPDLRLSADGEAVALTSVARSVSFPEGQAGLMLLRLTAVFAAPVAVGQESAADLTFDLAYATDVLGWREIVVTHGADVRLTASDAPLTDASDELRAYPDNLLANPLDRTSAAFTLAAAPGAPAALGYATFVAGDGPTERARPGGGSAGDRFAALLDGGALTPAAAALALLLAMVWGAMHALSPGHGKTVVGAYLVGARGTPRHACYLGLTVTVTHTAGVVALGLVTLLLSRFILPEQLYPWLSLVSGLLVAGMGVALVRQRLTGSGPFGGHRHDHGHDHGHHHHGAHVHHHHGDHDHDDARGHEHGHSHLPPERVTWRNLLALGISGGLAPCPSALVVLLGAIALGRVGFGMLLVVAFSLGLAAALTAVGILFLVAGRFIERRARRTRSGRIFGLALRYAPVAGALGVTVAGLVIVVRALDQTRLV